MSGLVGPRCLSCSVPGDLGLGLRVATCSAWVYDLEFWGRLLKDFGLFLGLGPVTEREPLWKKSLCFFLPGYFKAQFCMQCQDCSMYGQVLQFAFQALRTLQWIR